MLEPIPIQTSDSPPQSLVVQANIKQEKITPPQSPAHEIPAAVEETFIGTSDDKKCVEPIKSSNQLLDELFQTFNAAVPEDLLTELSSAGKKKNKKEKKSKKSKHRERKDGQLGESSGKERHKKAKVKKEKRDKEVGSPDEKGKHVKLEVETSVGLPKVKSEKRRIGYPGDEEDQQRQEKRSKLDRSGDDHDLKRHRRIKTERSVSRENRDQHRNRKQIKVERSRSRERGSKSEVVDAHLTIDRKSDQPTSGAKVLTKSTKIVIKNLKDSSIFKESEAKLKKSSHHGDDHHRHRHRRRRSDGNVSEASNNSILSLSDEETYIFERDRHFEHDRRDERSDRSRFRSRDRPRRTSDRHDRDVHRRSDHRSENRFYAGRDRYVISHFLFYHIYKLFTLCLRRPSLEREVIDKKRLLEVARRNAIQMLESGKLPGTQHISAEAKEKVLAKMRFGGKLDYI